MKRSYALFAVILAVSTLIGLEAVEVIDANPVPHEPMTPCVIEVSSPTETTYSGDVRLSFTVSEPDIPWNPCAHPGIGTVSYAIDGVRQPNNLHVTNGYIDERGPLSFSLNLPNLSEGQHTVTVTAWVHGLAVLNQALTMSEPHSEITVHFTIDRTAPKISILSEENKTYTTVIPLNFTIDTPTSWIGYSLDNQSNSTILGNSTLTDLTDGPHSIIIYANDTVGNMGKFETFSLAINNPTPTPTNPDSSVNLSYISAIVVVIAIVAVASVSLVYFKRRKGKP
jgi:hypothetical protein